MAAANVALKASTIIQSATPRIASLLASYDWSERSIRSIGWSDTAGSSSNDVASKSSISRDELAKWQSPHIPILTTRQLELSLLEIQRRHKRQRQKQTQTTQPSSSTDSLKNEAAVLVPLCTVDGTPSILFTRRSAQLSSHASQISFPGGYYDEKLDSTLRDAALRECQEELQYGIDQPGGNKELPFITILGQTQPVPSMIGKKVTPIIGTINYDLPHYTNPAFTKLFPGNPEEVDWIFTIPIRDLIQTETSEPLQRWGTSYSDKDEEGISAKWSNRKNWGPVFPIPEGYKKKEGDKIWGLTAIVLRPLLKRVFGPVFLGEDTERTSEENKDATTSKL